MKVLVVDDNKEILEILTMIIEEDGHQVTPVQNGDEFFRSVEKSKPDLVLLDIMLGKHDGRQLCASLKADEKTCHIPIVMISASHALQSLGEMKCEANGFIAKPFNIQHVCNIVNGFARNL